MSLKSDQLEILFSVYDGQFHPHYLYLYGQIHQNTKKQMGLAMRKTDFVACEQ